MYEPNDLNDFKKRLSVIFRRRLESKTGWGKNELFALFESCMKDAEIEMLKERLVKQA